MIIEHTKNEIKKQTDIATSIISHNTSVTKSDVKKNAILRKRNRQNPSLTKAASAPPKEVVTQPAVSTIKTERQPAIQNRKTDSAPHVVTPQENSVKKVLNTVNTIDAQPSIKSVRQRKNIGTSTTSKVIEKRNTVKSPNSIIEEKPVEVVETRIVEVTNKVPVRKPRSKRTAVKTLTPSIIDSTNQEFSAIQHTQPKITHAYPQPETPITFEDTGKTILVHIHTRPITLQKDEPTNTPEVTTTEVIVNNSVAEVISTEPVVTIEPEIPSVIEEQSPVIEEELKQPEQQVVLNTLEDLDNHFNNDIDAIVDSIINDTVNFENIQIDRSIAGLDIVAGDYGFISAEYNQNFVVKTQKPNTLLYLVSTFVKNIDGNNKMNFTQEKIVTMITEIKKMSSNSDEIVKLIGGFYKEVMKQG